MARTLYGGTLADYGIEMPTGRPAPGAICTAWTAPTGGAQATDLLDSDDAPSNVVTGDEFGFILFWGPDGYTADLWLHGRDDTPRLAVRPVDLTARIVAVEATLGTVALTEEGTLADAAMPASIARTTDLAATTARITLVENTLPAVRVRAYATGNGVTDDRPGILAAEAAAAASGRALDFGGPENTYAIGGGLILNTNRHWMATGATLRPTAACTGGVININGTGNCSIKGLRVDGNKTVALSANALITSVSNLDGVTLDVTLVNGRTYGIQLAGTASRVDITGTILEMGSSGVSFQGAGGGKGINLHNIFSRNTGHHGLQLFGGATPVYSDVTIENCRVAINNLVGVPMEVTSVVGFTMTGNVISGPGLRGISLGFVYDGTVTGNVVRNQSIYGIELNQIYRTTFSGNTIYDCDSGMAGQSSADLLIEGNLIHTTHGNTPSAYGVFLQQTTVPNRRITVQGNRFVDVALHGVRLAGAAEDIVVKGNVFSTSAEAVLTPGNDPVAVAIGGWTRGTVEDNVVTTALAGAGGATVGLIHITQACSDVHIRRNTLRGVGGAPLAKAGVSMGAVAATGLRIIDNYASGLTDGIRTVLNTSDDTVVDGNRMGTVTTPYNLKATHVRRTKRSIEATAPPTTGLWNQGDICWHSTPTAGAIPGWVCVSPGTPGTWRAMAALAA